MSTNSKLTLVLHRNAPYDPVEIPEDMTVLKESTVGETIRLDVQGGRDGTDNILQVTRSVRGQPLPSMKHEISTHGWIVASVGSGYSRHIHPSGHAVFDHTDNGFVFNNGDRGDTTGVFTKLEAPQAKEEKEDCDRAISRVKERDGSRASDFSCVFGTRRGDIVVSYSARTQVEEETWSAKLARGGCSCTEQR